MLRKLHAITFVCATATTFLMLSTIQVAVDTVFAPRRVDWNTFVEHSTLLDMRNCQCEELQKESRQPDDTAPSAASPPLSTSTFHPPPTYSGGASCGQLPEWGAKTIRHPRRPFDASQFRKDDIYVSFDSDREFAVPLEGMIFDLDSELYIFYHSNTPGALKIQFQLDEFPSRLTPVDGPFDLMGTYTSPYNKEPTAAPLRTAKFVIAAAAAAAADGRGIAHNPSMLAKYSNCHSLSATLPNGDVFLRKFKTVVRRPKVWLVTTIGVQNDLPLLHHFLTYYIQTVGIDPRNMIFTIHTTVLSDQRVRDAKQTLETYGIVHINDWHGKFNTFDKYEIQESLARRLVLQQDWVLNADLDEHQHYPFDAAVDAKQGDVDGGGISEYLSKCEDLGINAIFGELKDRVNVEGLLPTVDSQTPLADQFGLTCYVTKTIVGGSDTKVMARKGNLMAAEGGYHSLYEWKHTYGRNHHKINPHPTTHRVWHYKWTSQVLDKLKVREQQFKAQGIRWWVQSARMRAFLEKNNGTIDVSASALACKPNNKKINVDDTTVSLTTNMRQFPPGTNSDNVDDNANMYTVILMSYSSARRSNQEAILGIFANMAQVHEVLFLWNSDAKEMPTIPKGTLRPIRVEQQERNSLNNRWMESLNVVTDAVLMMDDDMMLPPHTLRSVFARWKHEPTRLVGTSARNFNGGEYLYPKHCCTTFPAVRKACSVIPAKQPSWCAHKLPARTSVYVRPPRFTLDAFCDTFKLVLPKGMMFHRKYLAAYSNPANKDLWEYVDKQGGHCDDIAFNFVVANMTRLAGVMVEDPVFNFPESDNGLYDASSEASKSTRKNLRSECLAWITKFFNGSTPPPFYVEAAEFWLRKQQRRAASPAVAANRQYSVMWKSMQQCVSNNGEKPR